MSEAIQPESQPLNRGRPTKFTPERIQQIRNLVERGMSQDQIAEIIGVTTGSLQVTCSKLGISLWRWYWLVAATTVARSQQCLTDSIQPTAGKYGTRVRGGTSASLTGQRNQQGAGWSATGRGLP